MGFRSDTRQLPIAQLGCAAGGAAINRAHDFFTAYPEVQRADRVAASSARCCYQPTDIGVGTLLSNGLFGDALAAAVVRGEGGTGVRLERNGSHLVPGHRELDLLRGPRDRLPLPARQAGPRHHGDARPRPAALVAEQHSWDVGGLDFYIVHAGGPRILDDLCHFSEAPPEMFRYSRATLTERGNIASAVIFDALDRLFEEGGTEHGDPGLDRGVRPRHHRGNHPGCLGHGRDADRAARAPTGPPQRRVAAGGGTVSRGASRVPPCGGRC